MPEAGPHVPSFGSTAECKVRLRGCTGGAGSLCCAGLAPAPAARGCNCARAQARPPRACQACLCRRPDARIGDRVRITPPFRLALRAGPLRVPLGGELPGEETFVQQRYMETEGPGSLRISRVGRFGEKKVAGSTFVHMKL